MNLPKFAGPARLLPGMLLIGILCSTVPEDAAMAEGVGAARSPRPEDPQAFLPPVLPWKGASEALIAKPSDPWITPAEKTGLMDTPNYEETVAYLRRLAAASPLIRMEEFGRSSQGRPLYVVIASRDQAFTPAAVRASGKPVLLAQAGIHAGEIDGKDAGLMLLRDIAFGGKEELLEGAQFLLVPVFNVDGHERASQWHRANQRGPIHQGWRATAQNKNLNRDYMKADTVEMRSMLRLINEWAPSLYLDLHVTDESDYEYDITFGFNGDPGVFAWSPNIADWLNQVFRREVESALTAAGHMPGPLVFPADERDPTKGHTAGTSMPRFAHGYGDLRHLPTVLVENHALKPYRQRVLGTYVLLEAALRVTGQKAGTLQKAIAADSTRRVSRLPCNWGNYDGPRTNRPFRGIDFEFYESKVSGRQELRWLGRPRFYSSMPLQLNRPEVELDRPEAYWVPVTSPEVIERLRIHGIRTERTSIDTEVRVQMYRLLNPRPLSTEAAGYFEGRCMLKAEVKPELRTEVFPAGSVRVPTDQPLGDLAMALLEPLSKDSLFAWGFFAEVLQQVEYIEAYVAAPMGEWMLAHDGSVKAEFEAKVKEDARFAADPNARLQWFYERSPFYDERYLLYPVGIEASTQSKSPVK